MANPQAENGHVDLANDIVEALARRVISPDEWRVLLVIFRKTYGWHKKEDWISLSQFQDITGMGKPHIHRAITKLISRGIIARIGNVTRSGKEYVVIYRFNKDFDKWTSLPKVATLPVQAKVVACSGNERLPIQATTKEIKETITKENTYDRFWESYPKKVGKKAAYRAWNSAKDKPPIEKILSALEIQKKSEQWLKDGGQYIPNPATWINQGRWDDEVKENSWQDKVKSLLSEKNSGSHRMS